MALDHHDTVQQIPYGCKPKPDLLAIGITRAEYVAEMKEFRRCIGQFEREWDNLKPVVEAPAYTKPLSFAYGVPGISDTPFTDIKEDCHGDDCIKEDTKYVFLFKSQVTFHEVGTYKFKTRSIPLKAG